MCEARLKFIQVKVLHAVKNALSIPLLRLAAIAICTIVVNDSCSNKVQKVIFPIQPRSNKCK